MQEKLGLSFLVGMAFQTILMVLLDQLNIAVTPVSITAATSVAVAAMLPFLYRKRQHIITPVKVKGINGLWIVFIGFIVYIEYMNFTKCLYFPTYDRDSLAGFDTIGYIISREHTIRHLSIFQGDYMPSIHGPGSYITYAPMVQLSYAYVYMFGAETSKLIPALMFGFFLLAFYGAALRAIGTSGAAVATFFAMMTPQMLSWSSLSGTNVIHAIYASLGVIYFTLWFRKREQSMLSMGALLLGINAWCRSEGIVFIGACLFIMLIDAIIRKQYKALIECTLIAAAPALLWTLFMKVNGLYAEGIISTHLIVDGAKLKTIWDAMTNHYSNTIYYGLTFIGLPVAILLNIKSLIKEKDNIQLLAVILLSSFLYMFLLYQVTYTWDSINNVLAYSAKRFLFCFTPMIWYYVFSNGSVVTAFLKLDGLFAREKAITVK